MSTDELFSIAGKTAVVTGGSQGIGLMIARGFVEAGANVYISALEADVCDRVAAELSELPGGGKCVSLPGDLSTQEGCKALADAVAEREDSLDILVNNAGVPGPIQIHRHTQPAWRKVMAVNVEAAFFVTRDLLPLLKAASREGDPARVVNMGSVGGLETTILETYGYGASKAALHHLTTRLARKLAPEVAVNALAPGPFDTPMMRPALAGFRRAIVDEVPLGRVGQAEDMAGVVIYLVSRAGAYLTGAVIPIDGGSTL